MSVAKKKPTLLISYTTLLSATLDELYARRLDAHTCVRRRIDAVAFSVTVECMSFRAIAR